MKCSQKDGFICILLFIFIFAAKVASYSLALNQRKNKEMAFPEYISSISESFPNPDIKPHRIVKKQMAVSDYLGLSKIKREVWDECRSIQLPEKKKSQKASNKDDSQRNIDKTKRSKNENPYSVFETLNGLSFEKSNFLEKRRKKKRAFLGIQRKVESKENTVDKSAQNERPSENKNCNKNLKNLIGRPCKRYVRFPDNSDNHCYYECEADRDGCMKLKHKKCPDGELFSPNYLECLREAYLKVIRRHKRIPPGFPKKIDVPEPNPEDLEPANEWLDASQGGGQKIPSEFKPKQKPKLKIYHLRSKRKLGDSFRLKRKASNTLMAVEARKKSIHLAKGFAKPGFRRHHPRSFLTRINEKDGKSQEQSVSEHENTDSEDDDDSYDDDDDEDGDYDEDDECEDDDENPDGKKKIERNKPSNGLKELFKSAKAAVTNKAKFSEEPSSVPCSSSIRITSPTVKNFKPEGSSTSEKPKKVLIDANIKVDSSLSSALKSILTKEENGPEPTTEKITLEKKQKLNAKSVKIYDNLIKTNLRVKRYFLSTLRT